MSYNKIFKSTLSNTDYWFDIWLENFGKESEARIWQPDTGDQRPRIPYVRKTLSAAGIPVPAASGAVNAHTPRYDILGNAESLSTSLQEMMNDLGVAMLQFPYLSPVSQLASRIREDSSGLLVHFEHCETAPYVATTGDWDAYWAGRGKSRREWGRRERKLMNREDTQFTCLTEWQDIAPIWNTILEIEASGWKGRAGSAIIQHRNTLNFYTTLAKHWAEAGCLRLFLLYDEGIPIAFELDAEFNGILHCFKHGYLESHAKAGPGQVLRIQILRWAFANEQVKIFDMFGPDTEAKRKWATHSEDLLTLKVFRPSPLGILAWSRFSLAPRIKAKIKGRH